MHPDDASDRLLLDVMLGTLATYLRMCGYDAAYALDRGVEADDELVALADREGRTLVTRDRRLAERTDDALGIESRDVREQLRELADAGIDLSLADPPRRCGRCNGRLEAVDDTDAERRPSLPEYVPDDAEAVYQCRECGQYFWRGSHWRDVEETLQAVRFEAES